MPTQYQSPYAATFRAAVRGGTQASKAVAAIAKHNNTTPTTVYTSLYKAGVCNRQKCNGQWVYWPCDGAKASSKHARNSQAEIWQQVIDWCIVSGQYSPAQVTNSADNQQHFVTFCHSAITRFNRKPATAAKRSGSTRTTARTAARKPTAKPVHNQFAHTAVARRYRRAA